MEVGHSLCTSVLYAQSIQVLCAQIIHAACVAGYEFVYMLPLGYSSDRGRIAVHVGADIEVVTQPLLLQRRSSSGLNRVGIDSV